jgi:DNA-binding beta-propeller fold protein YncE
MKPLCLYLFVLVSASFACGQSSTQTEKVLAKVADIPMPGPAVRFDYQTFDPSSGRLYIAHMNADRLVVFDTSKRQVVANLDGFKRVHGVTMVDLRTMKVLSTYQVGEDPDVLAYDSGLKRLYVSAESGTVTVFQSHEKSLSLLGSLEMPHAHTVSVDPKTHLVYFPLENIDGHPVLRIMQPINEERGR